VDAEIRYFFCCFKKVVMRSAHHMDVSEEKRKSLRPQHEILYFSFKFLICYRSYFKRYGSVEVVAAVCLGNVHSALKCQAPLKAT
jgi:hypothetical protein